MTAPTSSGNAVRDRLVAQLFQDHSEAVRRRIVRVDPSLADDVVSDTFATALRRFADIPVGAELPWLYVVADNLLRNQQRSRRRATNLTAALAAHAPRSAAPPEFPIVGPALQTLPDRDQALLTMTAFEGLSAVEAADRLGIPAGSARNAMVRGRRQLASTLAALGVVVASLIFAIVFAHQGRSAGQAGRSVAESIRGATTIFNVARVQATDDRSARQYRVYTDTGARRERITSPGGFVAGSDRGEPLHVVSLRGQTPLEVRAVQRRHAADLAALDAASPQEIARFLARDVRQRVTTDGPTLAGRETALVRGGIVDRAGKARELQLFITTLRPQVLRVRTRLVGARRWATIDFVKWEMVPRPPAGASPAASSAQGGAPNVAGPVAQGRAASGDAHSASGPLAPGAVGRAGGTITSKAAELAAQETARTGHRSDAGLRLPDAYTGPTGTVLHTRTVEDGRGAESWHEIGGGMRWRASVEESRLPVNPDGSTARLALWASPAVEMVVGSDGSTTTAYLPCAVGRRTGYVHPPQDDALLMQQFAWIGERLTAGASLPDGPTIDDRATVAVDLPHGASSSGQLRLIADRASGVPKRVIATTESGLTRVIDYAYWEILPARDAEAAIVQPDPERLTLRQPCS